MRFWDSSGLVLLLVDQQGSEQAKDLLREDPDIAVWWGSAVECWSALARLRRDGHLSPAAEVEAGRLLTTLLEGAFEVQPSEEVRRLSIRLLRVHPLRSADALQLAAALAWAGDPPPPGRRLVALDRRLREAAYLEGLTVLPATPEV